MKLPGYKRRQDATERKTVQEVEAQNIKGKCTLQPAPSIPKKSNGHVTFCIRSFSALSLTSG